MDLQQTVEDRILTLQEKKAELAKAALGSDGAKKMNKVRLSLP
jgi:SNF2 family DNA or RNA helicase